MITRVRQADRGGVALENAHPSTRESQGCNWTYACNRQLSGYRSLGARNFRLVGEIDSEKAFCQLPRKLTERYPRTPDNVTAVFKYIVMLTGGLWEKDVFNMPLSDRHYVMVFCSTNLSWITRRAPFSVATLLDQDVGTDSSSEATPSDVIIVTTTQPLAGNETW